MAYNYKRLILYIVLLAAILIIWWIISGFIFAESGKLETQLMECFTDQVNMSYYPYVYTMGSLIDCLSFYESGNNPLAVGKAGEIGCLQFMPSTFQHYCVKKYGLPDDIWNEEIQRECADKMLKQGLINHWSTKNLCLSVSNVDEE